MLSKEKNCHAFKLTSENCRSWPCALGLWNFKMDRWILHKNEIHPFEITLYSKRILNNSQIWLLFHPYLTVTTPLYPIRPHKVTTQVSVSLHRLLYSYPPTPLPTFPLLIRQLHPPPLPLPHLSPMIIVTRILCGLQSWSLCAAPASPSRTLSCSCRFPDFQPFSLAAGPPV